MDVGCCTKQANNTCPMQPKPFMCKIPVSTRIDNMVLTGSTEIPEVDLLAKKAESCDMLQVPVSYIQSGWLHNSAASRRVQYKIAIIFPPLNSIESCGPEYGTASRVGPIVVSVIHVGRVEDEIISRNMSAITCAAFSTLYGCYHSMVSEYSGLF